MKYLLILGLFLLNSCMKYHEEIWLNKDMSGKIQFDMEIHQIWSNFKIPQDSEIIAIINQSSGVVLHSLSQQETDSLLTISALLGFENPGQLQAVFSHPLLHAYLGDINMTTNKKGHFVLRRLMEGKESPFFKEKEIVSNLTLAEKQTMDLGLPWEWKIHAPTDVLFRTKGFRKEEGGPHEYNVNFKKVASSGVKLRMTFENEDAGVPTNVWIATGAFALVMTLIGLGLLIGRTKRARIVVKQD